MKLVNLFAGPGTGKSTTAAGVFHNLKLSGVNCEMALEYAKERVWQEDLQTLDNQIYVFGKQLQRIRRLENKVDVVITDSPLLLSLIYGKKEVSSFHQLVLDTHKQFDNINIFLRREKQYNPSGRLQSELEAEVLDNTIKEMLNNNSVSYETYNADKDAAYTIANRILNELGKL